MGIFSLLGMKNPGVTVVDKIATNAKVNAAKNPVLPKGHSRAPSSASRTKAASQSNSSSSSNSSSGGSTTGTYGDQSWKDGWVNGWADGGPVSSRRGWGSARKPGGKK